MHIPQISLHRVLRLKSELSEIYTNQLIQTFALTLIGVFVPIYLLKLGFALNTVLVFVGTHLLAMGIMAPFAARVASKLGLKHVILYRLPGIILFYILLLLAGTYDFGTYILLVALLGGTSDSFYWISLNSEFVKNSDKLHGGREVGNLIAFPRLAAIVAPFLGALVLETMGFTTLFVLAIILLFLSVAPLFLTGDMKSAFSFRIDQTKFLPRKRIEKKFALDFISRGIVFLSETVLWPLWIFVQFSSLLDVGFAMTLGGAGMGISTLVLGKKSDGLNKIKLMKILGVCYSAVWLLRIFSGNVIEVFILSFLGGMFIASISLAMYASFCDFARNRNILVNIAFREDWLTVGRIALLALLILLASMKFEAAFAIAGIFSLFLLLI